MNLVNVVLDRQEVIQHYRMSLKQVPVRTVLNPPPRYEGYWYIVYGKNEQAAHAGAVVLPAKYIRIVTEGIDRGEYVVTDLDPDVPSNARVMFRTQALAQQGLDSLHRYLIKRDTR